MDEAQPQPRPYRFEPGGRARAERREARSDRIVEHEDVRDLGRVRAVHDHIVAMVAADRRIFQPAGAAGGSRP